MSHSRLPWRQVDTTIEDADGNLIIECKHGTEEERLLNARYTVASANACAGLTQDHFDGGWKAKELIAYAKSLAGQRDVLLSALNRLMACSGEIAVESDEGLKEALTHPLANAEAREIAAAFLQAREAVRAVTP